MGWIYLIIEWGWPAGLKLGWADEGANYNWLSSSCLTNCSEKNYPAGQLGAAIL